MSFEEMPTKKTPVRHKTKETGPIAYEKTQHRIRPPKTEKIEDIYLEREIPKTLIQAEEASEIELPEAPLFNDLYDILSENTEKRISNKEFQKLISPKVDTSVKIEKILSAFKAENIEQSSVKEDILDTVDDILNETRWKEAAAITGAESIANLPAEKREEILRALEKLEEEYEKKRKHLVRCLGLEKEESERQKSIGTKIKNIPDTPEEQKAKEEKFIIDLADLLTNTTKKGVSEKKVKKLLSEKINFTNKINRLLDIAFENGDRDILMLNFEMRKQLAKIIFEAMDSKKANQAFIASQKKGKVDAEFMTNINRKYAKDKNKLIKRLRVDPDFAEPLGKRGLVIEDEELEKRDFIKEARKKNHK